MHGMLIVRYECLPASPLGRDGPLEMVLKKLKINVNFYV